MRDPARECATFLIALAGAAAAAPKVSRSPRKCVERSRFDYNGEWTIQASPRCRGRRLANVLFSGLDSRVPSRASLRGILDPEDGRAGVRRNKRRIERGPTDARGLPRIIAALDEDGAGRKARTVRRRAAV